MFRPKFQALLPLLAVGTLTLAAPAPGEDTDDQAAPALATGSGDELTTALFDAVGGPGFKNALSKAQASGVPEQMLLEARFLNLIDRQDNAGIAALSTDLVARKDAFKLTDSQIFGVAEEWQAVVHYSQSLAALENNDRAGFKTHIQEAFWLSPRLATVLAPHIEKLRLEDAMKKVRVDLNKNYSEQGTNKDITLGGLAKESPLILLHFWSPWSQECEAFLDDFIATANELAEKNVTVVSILADSAPEILPDANSYRESVNKKTAGFWILDDEKAPLAVQLRIPDLPTMVVIDRAGKVHFNGHPSDARLWTALQEIVPAVKRPALENE